MKDVSYTHNNPLTKQKTLKTKQKTIIKNLTTISYSVILRT